LERTLITVHKSLEDTVLDAIEKPKIAAFVLQSWSRRYLLK
jgi:hypothetical protein